MAADNAQFIRRRIISRWRELTGGSDVRDPDRPTLVALSGGGDSSGLLIALSTLKNAKIIAAHIRHGLRPELEQSRDAEESKLLAEKLEIPFVVADIDIPNTENAEAAARRLRYDSLLAIALDTGCKSVATGHHAEDQLETMLMAMTRGTGLTGLAGIAPVRELGDDVDLIRPALLSTRSELMALCDSVEWQPAYDETNSDQSRTRSWIRSNIIPALLEHSDTELPNRLAATATILTQAQSVMTEQARSIVSSAVLGTSQVEIEIELLAPQQQIIIGEVLRLLATSLVGKQGQDSRGWKHLEPIITAIQTKSMHSKEFHLRGIEVTVSGKKLILRAQSVDMNSVTSATSRSKSAGSFES